MVLKDPVFIINCGHRLCKLCFQSLQSYASQHNNPLLCPHDRKEVDPDKVVDDKGVARTVMDLQVYCNNKAEGCNWSGELRQLDDHVDTKCHVTSLQKFMERMEKRLDEKDREVTELLERMVAKDDQVKHLEQLVLDMNSERNEQTQIEQRLNNIERQLHEKNEEVAYLKLELSGLRVEFLRDAKDQNQVPAGPESKKRKTISALINVTEEKNDNSIEADMCSESC